MALLNRCHESFQTFLNASSVKVKKLHFT